MRKIIIGFFCGLLLSSGVFFALKLRTNESLELAHRLTAFKQEGELNSFKIYHFDQYLFEFTVLGNGFYLLVKEDNLLAPRLLFRKLNQYSDGIRYSLTSSRRLEDGRELTVDYNMDTGEIETSSYWDGNQMIAYDKEGNPIEINSAKMESQLESLDLRRKKLSEALKKEGNSGE